MDWTHPLLAIPYGVVAALLVIWIERWQRTRVHRKFDGWRSDLYLVANEVIDAHAWVARCEMKLAEKIGQLPEDFHPAIFMAARIGHRVEKAVLLEAEQRGLYDPRNAPPPVPVEDEIAEPTSTPLPSDAPTPPPVVPLRRMVWQDGKLRPAPGWRTPTPVRPPPGPFLADEAPASQETA